MTTSVSIVVPGTLNTLGAAASLAGFSGKDLTVQFPSTAGVGDSADFYAGNINNATSVDQLVKVPNLTLPTPEGQSGQLPSSGATSVPYLFLYAVRTAIQTVGALTATLAGAEAQNGAGSGNNILQGGNSFGADIHIGPKDGFQLILGGPFAGANCTGIGIDTTVAGPINIGTTQAGEAITVGNVLGATGVALNAGTGGIQGTATGAGGVNLTAGATGTFIGAGGSGGAQVTTVGGGPILVQSDTTGTVTVDSGTTGDVNLGTGLAGVDANAKTIRVGTGAGVKALFLGSPFGASSAVLDGGTGGVLIQTGASGLLVGASGIAIGCDAASNGAVTVAAAGTGGVNLAGGTGPSSFSVGAGATLGLGANGTDHTTALGSTAGVSNTTVQAGTGTLTINAQAGGTVSIAANAAGQTVNLGTGAAVISTTVGSTFGASPTALRAGTGGLSLVNNGVTWTWPTADGVAGAPSLLQSNGAGVLSFAQFQRGTSSIGAAGTSAAIAANIMASSRIVVTVKDFVASTAVGLEAKAADRVVGAPGSFIVTAYDAAAAAVAGANGTTFDWVVID